MSRVGFWIFTASMVGFVLLAAAFAPDRSDQLPVNRFSMFATKDGTVVYRLDTQGGQMDICYLRKSELLCEPLPMHIILSTKELKP